MDNVRTPSPQIDADLDIDNERASASAAEISVAYGDGIGPEIMRATLDILRAAGARLIEHPVEMGEALYLAGNTSGIDQTAWDRIRQTRVLLKAPITTPSGGGYKSLNVTLRKALGLYANVRPCIGYAPFVERAHPSMNLIVVRENEEDLYAGIEHRQTDEVYQCLKLISRSGCERIVRHAFELARQEGRKKVTCMVKDNIMKLTDGLFAKVFEEIGAEYPDIARERYIVDIGAARLATRPERFDIIVTPNLYGDILSDIAAEVSGSVGLAGSANIGHQAAMFEAVHGSAPDIAGQDIANPSGLLMAGVMMLRHLGQVDVASRVHNAWLRTLELGLHTADIAGQNTRQILSTSAFAKAVIEHLGEQPQHFSVVAYSNDTTANPTRSTPAKVQMSVAPAQKALVGVDVFVQQSGNSVNELALRLQSASSSPWQLQLITNRGIKVWPQGWAETLCTDHWRCRFVAKDPAYPLNGFAIASLLTELATHSIDVIKTENLYTFDGQPGFSLAQGQ